MSNVIVVGGGAGGMMAAYAAASIGHQVILLEKNEKLGKKIYITGKGRCNITNACSTEVFFHNVVTNPKFLYSSIYQFDSMAVMNFLKEAGCEIKVERGDRVFPVSNHSSDVIDAMRRAMKDVYVEVKLNTAVKDVIIDSKEKKICGVITQQGEKMQADAVILACGGLSYPSTGSTGEGYIFAKKAGHSIQKTNPALVPFVVQEDWYKELQGLALKNVQLSLYDGKKNVYEGFGEMLFTHFGISGPLILSASSYYDKMCAGKKVDLFIDLKPALDLEKLDKRVLRIFEENNHKEFKNALNGLFPHKLTPIMIKLSGISPECKIYDIDRDNRLRFVNLIKHLPLTVVGTRGFNEAVITQGGVSVQDVNPSTMESKICRGLYFAGEMLDLDALTGGFNLQIAWSTGHLAGSSIPW